MKCIVEAFWNDDTNSEGSLVKVGDTKQIGKEKELIRRKRKEADSLSEQQ